MVLPRQGPGNTFPSVVIDGALDQLSHLPQVAKDWGTYFLHPQHHVADKDQFSHSHALRSSLSVPLTTGLALAWCKL